MRNAIAGSVVVPRLGDDDGRYRIVFECREHLGEIVLRNVLTGEEYDRILVRLVEQLERVAHGVYHRFRAEIGAADADADYDVRLRTEFRRLAPR